MNDPRIINKKPVTVTEEPQIEDHEEERRSEEQDQQQDLNQGMSTGTHDSTRHGVNWGPAYRNTATPKDDKR